MRHPSAALLIFLCAASPLQGQALKCAWQQSASSSSQHRTEGLNWFSGTYQLVRVETDDECQDPTAWGASDEGENCQNQREILMGLNSLTVPGQVAYPSSFFGDLLGGGWRSTELGNRYRSGTSRGVLHFGWRDPSVSMQLVRLPSELRYDPTHAWCTSPGREPFRLQFGVARDLRWGPAGILNALCEGITFGMFCDRKSYSGPGGNRDDDVSHTIPNVLNPGWGFPTVQWQVRYPADAREHARRFLQNGDPRYATNFTTYEGQLWGRIYREPRSYYGCTRRFLGICTRREWVQTFAFIRQLGGEIRMTSYLDPRIGLPDFDPPRFVYQVRTLWQGDEIYFEDADRMNSLANQLQAFCGSRLGCDFIPHTSALGASPPFGFTFSDDAVDDVDRLCGTMLRQGEHRFGLPRMPALCSDPANPLLPDRDPTSAELERDVTERGMGTPQLTDADKEAFRTGRRTVGSTVIHLDGEWERRCLRVAQRDSSELVNAPVPVDEGQPPAVPVALLFDICVADTESRFGLDLGIARRSPDPTPALDPNRCFWYRGHVHCIR